MSIIILMAAAAFAQNGTSQAATALTFLKDVGQGRVSEARRHLSQDVLFESRSPGHASNLEAFGRFAGECEFKQVRAMTGRSASPEMPLFVEWSCGSFQDDRQAAFWISEGKIDRVAFGPETVVRISPVTPPPSTP